MIPVLKVKAFLICVFFYNYNSADSANIKILNAGAWSRSSEKVFVSLPTELEDLIPEVEEFYKKNHSGRKLHWHHLMSNGIITFKNEVGQYDLEVTTFQLAVLFAWNQRPREKISFENLKLATELPDAELRRTLWVSFLLEDLPS
ncbi:CUL5 protein, partial [Polyodon spathula]|nr:CUL5 protein [Polyodon spathula]